MEDLIGKNRSADKNKKKDKLSLPKSSKQNPFEEDVEEEEAIYAPPAKKSKNGGKKVKSANRYFRKSIFLDGFSVSR